MDSKNSPRSAAMLLIGNELLSGKVQDQNFAYLSGELYALGVELQRAVIILDQIEIIAKEVKQLANTHEILFTSGGVGPTHDDVTIEGIAKAFEREVVLVPEIEEQLRSFYQEKLSEEHLRMALAPKGVHLIKSDSLRWPTMRVENVYIFPGVPEIFRLKFQAIRHVFLEEPFTLAEIFLSCDEASIAKPLREIVDRFPAVQFGSYPRYDKESDHRVKLTIECKNFSLVQKALSSLSEALSETEILRVTQPYSPKGKQS